MTNWRRLLARSKFVLRNGSIRVRLEEDHEQTVNVDETADGQLRLWATVAGRTEAANHDQLELRVWQRNRFADLVGFVFDADGRLVGQSVIPLSGLTTTELALHIRAIASACDRFEHQLTGRDWY